MKEYPSISRDPRYGSPCYVFAKLDGSNVRAEWTRKRGFDKFGARKTMLGPDHWLGEAIDLVKAQEEPFEAIFREQRWDRVVCFFEYWGANSFAGLHEAEPHRATLIDVGLQKSGLLDPRDFVRLFWNQPTLDVAPFLAHGGFNREDEARVRRGEYPGQSFEGIVGKMPSSRGPAFLFKAKSQAWISRVKERYGDRAEEVL